MSETKRRRIEVGHHGRTSSSTRTAELSPRQLDQELDALRNGRITLRTIAWSPQNLIASASPFSKPEAPPVHKLGLGPGPTGAQAQLPGAAVGALQHASQQQRAQGTSGPTDRDAQGNEAHGAETQGAVNTLTAEERQRDAAEQLEQKRVQARAHAFSSLMPPPAQSVTLRCMPFPEQQRSKHASKHAGPAAAPRTHRLFPSMTLLPASSAVVAPTLVSFSPSGRTLVAYFPSSPLARRIATATRAGELAMAAQVHAQVHAQASSAAGATGADPNLLGQPPSRGGPTAPGIGPTPILGTTPGQTSIVAHTNPDPVPAPPDPSKVPTSLAPSAGKGRLCIWTQGPSLALNDWILRQVILVEDANDEPPGGREEPSSTAAWPAPAQAPPGFIHVDNFDEAIPVPIPAGPLGPGDAVLEGATPGAAPIATLSGGIHEVRWCDEGRKLFTHPEAGQPAVDPKAQAQAGGEATGKSRAHPDPHRSYIRDVARGPTFARPEVRPSAMPQSATSQSPSNEAEEACFLFSRSGQVTVLHRRPFTSNSRLPPAFPNSQPFSVTSSTLFEADAVSLGTMSDRVARSSKPPDASAPSGGTKKLSHLSVGGVPDEPLFLVAYRIEPESSFSKADAESGFPSSGAPLDTAASADAAADAAAAADLMAQATSGVPHHEQSANMNPLGLVAAATGSTDVTNLVLGLGASDGGMGLGLSLDLNSGLGVGAGAGADLCLAANGPLEGMIGLCELRLRTRGDAPALVVRPLDPLPLPSLQRTQSTAEEALQRPHTLTHLQWLEYPAQTHTPVEGPTPLQLLMVCSHDSVDTAASRPDAMDVDGAQADVSGARASSVHKYLVQRQLDPLAEAFGALECKKADLPLATADWAFAEAGGSVLSGLSVLTVLPPQELLEDQCLLSVAKLAISDAPQTAKFLHAWTWLDPTTLSVSVIGDVATVPAQPGALQTLTEWKASPNKAWIARVTENSTRNKVQLLQVPLPPRLAAIDLPSRAALLLGRALKADTNADDVATLLTDFEDDQSHQVAVADAFVRAGLGSEATQTRAKLSQVQKLVELYMLKRGPNLDTQRLFLELLLCLRLLSLNDLGKRSVYLPFRFDATWALLSQLTWILRCLNRLCRSAVYLEAEAWANGAQPPAEPGPNGDAPDRASANPQHRTNFASPNALLELLALPASRAMFTHVLQSLYRFAFWLIGDEAGPIHASFLDTKDGLGGKAAAKLRSLGIRGHNFTAAVSRAVLHLRKTQINEGEIMPGVEAFQGPGAQSTIAQQYDFAADACRALLDASAVRLDKAVTALESLPAIPPSEDGRKAWWTELSSAVLSQRDEYRKVAASWLDEDAGAGADLVPLFISPGDLLDDMHALDRINVSAAATIQVRQSNGMPKPHQTRDHPEDGAYGKDVPDLGYLTTDIIRKIVLQPSSVSFEQSASAAAALLNGFGPQSQPPPASLVPTPIKVCVRCQGRTGTYELAPVLSKSLAPVEEAFREQCLCGGSWWLQGP
ncbi:hypothetical protein V8E36_002791 [Tilletia maclaganii]